MRAMPLLMHFERDTKGRGMISGNQSMTKRYSGAYGMADGLECHSILLPVTRLLLYNASEKLKEGVYASRRCLPQEVKRGPRYGLASERETLQRALLFVVMFRLNDEWSNTLREPA